MQNVRREIWHDVDCGALWELELLDDSIVGCIGPFRDESAVAAHLGEVAVERNPQMLRWLRHRRHLRGPCPYA